MNRTLDMWTWSRLQLVWTTRAQHTLLHQRTKMTEMKNEEPFCREEPFFISFDLRACFVLVVQARKPHSGRKNQPGERQRGSNEPCVVLYRRLDVSNIVWCSRKWKRFSFKVIQVGQVASEFAHVPYAGVNTHSVRRRQLRRFEASLVERAGLWRWCVQRLLAWDWLPWPLTLV